MGSVNIAFRAQLVVPEQRQLYDYWLGCASGQDMPTRADINPAQIPRLLPYHQLIDVHEDIGRSKVRLAGTRLRDVYDREITGLASMNSTMARKRDYWMAAYRHTVHGRQADPGHCPGSQGEQGTSGAILDQAAARRAGRQASAWSSASTISSRPSTKRTARPNRPEREYNQIERY